MHRRASSTRMASAIKVTRSAFVRNLYKVGEKRKKDAEEERREMARIEQVRPFSHPPHCLSYTPGKADSCTRRRLAFGACSHFQEL